MNRDQLKKLEADLWAAADKLRANSDLKASEYSTPVLGLIFLKFADNKYRQHEAAIEQEYEKLKGIRFDHSAIAPLWMKYFLKLYYDSGLVGLYQVQSTGISNYQFEAFITRQTVLVPDMRLQAEFCKLVEPLNEQRDSLARANLRLKNTRDALLPRLISGKLRVEALDIQFPPSMQPPPAEAAQREAIAR